MNSKAILNFFFALLALLCITGQTISSAHPQNDDPLPQNDDPLFITPPQLVDTPQIEEPIFVGLKLVLEVSEADLLTRYALNPAHPEFVAALTKAKAAQSSSSGDLLTLFYDAYLQINAKDSLSVIFAGKQVEPTYSNQEVIAVLRAAYHSAVESTFNVLSARITNSKFYNPTIKKLEPTGRIAIELPKIDDPQRVVKLLQRRGDLQFWPTYSADEFFSTLVGVSDMLDKIIPEFKQEKSAKTESPDDIVSLMSVSAEDLGQGAKGGLWAILHPYDDHGVCVATVRGCDTAQVNGYFAMPEIRPLIPSNVTLMWSMMPNPETDLLGLYAIKTDYSHRAPLDGSSIVDAEAFLYMQDSYARVSMVMNDVGSRIFARLTADNIGEYIAMTVDNYVYSCPRVNYEITDGSFEIAGDYTIYEARDLASVLKSGQLPVSVRVVEQAIVEAEIEADVEITPIVLWTFWLVLAVLLAAAVVVFLVRRSRKRSA